MGKIDKDLSTQAKTPPAVRIPVEAYVSEDYARAERDKLWRKVWLQAGRLEDLPEVGSYVTYDILDDSVLIVRTAPDRIKAYHNVCTHRGRKLVDTPRGERNARGRRRSFVCGFHAWTFDIEGKCTYIQADHEWGGALCDEVTRLGEVRLDTWGGFLWINLDPDCEPLRDYLEPAASMLDPFELQNMKMEQSLSWNLNQAATSSTKRISQNFDQPKNLQMKMDLDLKCGQRSHMAFYREKVVNC